MQRFLFHPVVATWFEQKFGSPTEPQERGWPAIQSGAHTLIAAPTGSGKTLAAFMAALDRLFRDGLEGKLNDQTRVLYVSPKALSNDIHKISRNRWPGFARRCGRAKGATSKCGPKFARETRLQRNGGPSSRRRLTFW
jgi:Lhr-like helicase